MGDRKRFDIVCRVVDNYGDAGVGLRLARQLVYEHDLEVTLWIDDRARLARIAPDMDPALVDQRHDGVRIRALTEPMPALSMPDVVIEAFGCGLPQAYLDAMQAAARQPVWIVLEHLSAERWVDDAHGLPSPHPQRPLKRWFFFPGFTPRSAGLIRERDLFARRDAFLAEAGGDRAHRVDDVGPLAAQAFTVSLFCYANAALPMLLEAWADADEALRCLVPEGVAVAALDRFFQGNVPHAGEQRRAGSLVIVDVPFVDQAAFDRRLWTCDVNIVRGEDSLVRALWAARACCWHIYPQQERAHLAKLDALLRRYAEGLDTDSADAVRAFWMAFNEEDGAATASAWPAFRSAVPALARHARSFAVSLAQPPDLASKLVAFSLEQL